LYHIAYDGSVVDEETFSVLGGEAEEISRRLGATFQPDSSLAVALRACVDALAGPDRTLPASDLEVGMLSDANGRRAFRRVEADEITTLLAG
jgi:proteasome alpha subunit